VLPSLLAVAKKYQEVRRALEDAVVAGRDSDTVPVGTLGSIRRVSGLERLR
jgi:ADP-ribosylglycohydrolase